MSLLIGGAVVLLLAAATAAREPAGYWVPEGFVGMADTLIERGYLELRCGEQDSIAVRFPPGSAEEEFFNLSYLRSDVRTFNANPDASRSPFLIEGCRLRGVDPFYHRIDLPFNRLPRWRGDLRFTFDGRTATLEGGRTQLLEVRHPVAGRDAAARSVRVSPEDRGANIHAPLIQLRRPRGREVMADLYFVGEDAVLAERGDPGRTDHLLVNGFQVPPGRLVRLESGDWLEVQVAQGAQPPARYTYLAETGERARTASFVRTRNDRVQRLFPASRLQPLLEPFSQAMDLALQSIPGGQDPAADIANTHVRLTFDRELQGELEEQLVGWCRERAHPTRPRAVSILVMEAFTGAVRALPSCPGEDELAPYEPLSTRTRDAFLRNQNLIPHPIGSAGKPFWAAAVASTFPNFLDLEVPAHGAGLAGTVLGCPVGAGYNDSHGSDQRVGLEQFMAGSCNRYLIEMATAALAVRPHAGSPDCRSALPADRVSDCFTQPLADERAASLHFCDRLVQVVLSPELDAVGSDCTDLQLLDSKFAPGPTFSSLTNVASYRELSPAPGDVRAGLTDRYRAERYRIDVWHRVLEELQAAGDTAHWVQTSLRFAAVSPQATNLALNTVEELRTDWVNLLLGGENSRWSNFELAEALARLVTGRDVKGEFVDSIGGRGQDWAAAKTTARVLPENVLHPGARRRILHAMERVGEFGTARALDGAIRGFERRLADAAPGEPYDVYVFTKTGTPTVEKFLTAPQHRLLLQLHERGELRWNAAARRIIIDPAAESRVRASFGEPTLRWIRTDMLEPIERDPDAFTARPGRQLPDHPLYFDGAGRLLSRELRDLRATRQGGLLLIGVLAMPRSTGRAAAVQDADWVSACPLDPSLRRRILEIPRAEALDPDRAVAVTAAIYVDDLPVGQGSDQAIGLAARALEPLASYLEKEIRRKVARSGG